MKSLPTASPFILVNPFSRHSEPFVKLLFLCTLSHTGVRVPTDVESGAVEVPQAQGGGRWDGAGTHIKVERLSERASAVPAQHAVSLHLSPLPSRAGLAIIPSSVHRSSSLSTLFSCPFPQARIELSVDQLKRTIAEVYYRYLFPHPALADVRPPPEDSRAEGTRAATGASEHRRFFGQSAGGAAGPSGSNKAARLSATPDEVRRH